MTISSWAGWTGGTLVCRFVDCRVKPEKSLRSLSPSRPVYAARQTGSPPRGGAHTEVYDVQDETRPDNIRRPKTLLILNLSVVPLCWLDVF